MKMNQTFTTTFYRGCSKDERAVGKIGPLVETLLVSASSLTQAHKEAKIEAKRRDWRYCPEWTEAKA